MLSLKNKNSLLIKLVASLGILALLAYKLNYTQVVSYLDGAQGSIWIVVTLCILLQIALLSYRWFLIINAREKRTGYFNAIQITIASNLANYVFITSIGGLVVRVALSVQSGFSVVRSIAGTAIDRLMTLSALLILTIIFLPISVQAADNELIRHFFLVLCILCFSGLLLSAVLFTFFHRKIIFSHRKITALFKYIRILFTDKLLLNKIVLCSLLAQLSYFAAVYVLTASYGITFSWISFLAIIPFVTIIASLPLGYGGWGIREGAFVYGLGVIDIPVDLAFSVSIQIGLISIMASAIAFIFTVALPKAVCKIHSRI